MASKFTDRDKTAARIIVSIFETGTAAGNYSEVAVLADGAGISYGAHQGTHRSGTLLKIVQRYCELKPEATAAFAEYLPKLGDDSDKSVAALSRNAKLKSLLRQAGRDPLMRRAQDEVFDSAYMRKAEAVCEGSNFVFPLTLAVIYDSHIHGSWARIRDRVPAGLPEKQWIARYIAERRAWLAGHKNPLLRKTVYRMDAFQKLVATANWHLQPPFTVRGVRVTSALLDGPQPDVAPIPSAPPAGGAASLSADEASDPQAEAGGVNPDTPPALTTERSVRRVPPPEPPTDRISPAGPEVEHTSPVQPQQAAVTVEAARADTLRNKVNVWVAAIIATLSGVWAAASAFLGGMAEYFRANPMMAVLAAGALVGLAVIAKTIIDRQTALELEKKRQAHDITLTTAQLAADPTKSNVEIVRSWR
jgi:chitosanase